MSYFVFKWKIADRHASWIRLGFHSRYVRIFCETQCYYNNYRDIIITRYATLIGCILESTKPEVLLHGRARCRFGGVHFPNTA